MPILFLEHARLGRPLRKAAQARGEAVEWCARLPDAQHRSRVLPQYAGDSPSAGRQDAGRAVGQLAAMNAQRLQRRRIKPTEDLAAGTAKSPSSHAPPPAPGAELQRARVAHVSTRS